MKSSFGRGVNGAERTGVWGWTLASVVLSVALGCGSSRDKNPSGVSSSASSGGVGSSSSGTGGGGAGGGGGGGAGSTPPTKYLPDLNGSCPKLENGPVTFSVDGLEPREVEVRISEAAETKDGPIVLLWHADELDQLQAYDPSSAIDDLLGEANVQVITNLGGIVVAPSGEPGVGAGLYPWYLTLGADDNLADLLVMDQIIACVMQEPGIDTRHIHLVGYSEGAMHVAQAAVLRSGYVASVVVHSASFGGKPEAQDGENAYAAMVLYGGQSDGGLADYGKGSVDYADLLVAGDSASFASPHFTVLCNHDGGNVVATDALDATVAFMLDHPYGVEPPYSTGLPKSFPDFCEIYE